jgi:hypothetical protein
LRRRGFHSRRLHQQLLRLSPTRCSRRSNPFHVGANGFRRNVLH